MVNVAIYCRLSDEDRNKQNAFDESESIQNQKSMLTDYCRERNWDVFDIYCDEDYSGIDSTRPAFNRMLNDCCKGRINIVLCKSQSRFSRDMEVIEKYLHNKFIEWEVRFIGVVDHTDTADAANKKSRQINGLVNEWYLEDVSENIRKTLQHKRENGEFTGSFAPYGYAIDPENKHHLILDEPAASVVHNIFEWYNQGWGYRKIVLQLNNMNIPSPVAYKEQHNSKFRCMNVEGSSSKGLWTQSTIYRMIRNETYTGSLVQGKSHKVSYKNKKLKFLPEDQWIKIPNAHEPIISQELWQATKKRLESRLRVAKVTTELSVLSGKVKCAECGKPMYRNIYYNKKRTIQYYSLCCGSYTVGAMNCSNVSSMSGLELEKIIIEQINLFTANYFNRDKIQIKSDFNKQILTLQGALQAYSAVISDKRNKIDKAYEDKLNNVITLEQYNYYKNKFQKEVQENEAKAAGIEKELATLNERQRGDGNIDKIVKKYSHVEQLSRIMVEELIDVVLIGSKEANKPRPITIKWNI